MSACTEYVHSLYPVSRRPVVQFAAVLFLLCCYCCWRVKRQDGVFVVASSCEVAASSCLSVIQQYIIPVWYVVRITLYDKQKQFHRRLFTDRQIVTMSYHSPGCVVRGRRHICSYRIPGTYVVGGIMNICGQIWTLLYPLSEGGGGEVEVEVKHVNHKSTQEVAAEHVYEIISRPSFTHNTVETTNERHKTFTYVPGTNYTRYYCKLVYILLRSIKELREPRIRNLYDSYTTLFILFVHTLD